MSFCVKKLANETVKPCKRGITKDPEMVTHSRNVELKAGSDQKQVSVESFERCLIIGA